MFYFSTTRKGIYIQNSGILTNIYQITDLPQRYGLIISKQFIPITVWLLTRYQWKPIPLFSFLFFFLFFSFRFFFSFIFFPFRFFSVSFSFLFFSLPFPSLPAPSFPFLLCSALLCPTLLCRDRFRIAVNIAVNSPTLSMLSASLSNSDSIFDTMSAGSLTVGPPCLASEPRRSVRWRLSSAETTDVKSPSATHADASLKSLIGLRAPSSFQKSCWWTNPAFTETACVAFGGPRILNFLINLHSSLIRQ